MRTGMDIIREGMESFERVEKEAVVFNAEQLGYSGTKMVAKDFHLPFPSMVIYLQHKYKLNDEQLDYIRIVNSEMIPAGKVGSYRVVSLAMKEALEFKILESGEIEMLTVDSSKFSNNFVEAMSQLKERADAGESILIQQKEKHFYNFVYDIISTIDFINSSDYVVTKHTTRKATGEKLKGGLVERRIKIKHTKFKHPGYHGTGLGTKHRYKYRVRGHWREYDDGSRTWIKDHVRGGDGTIFIPKEYEIE